VLSVLTDIELALMPWCGILTGLFGIDAVNAFRADAQIRAEVMTYLAGTGLLGLLLWWRLADLPWTYGVVWVLWFALGLVTVLFWHRELVQRLDRWKARWTLKSGLARQGRTDVRDLEAVLPAVRHEYDARQYYRRGKFFLGLDQYGKPIYWEGRFPHAAVAGTTGSGKGRKLQDFAAQSVWMNEALIYLDPKNDEWGPHALHAACRVAGKPYHYIDLLPAAPAQFNILAGASAWEVEELLSSVLDLGDKGKSSDFFAAKNRAAAKEAARLAAEDQLTLYEVYQRMIGDAAWKEEAPGFLDKLSELAGLAAINAKDGVFSLQKLVDDGGGVYVVGSMTLQSVRRAQQMIFVRAQQIATARDRMKGSLRTVCVIADEAKYHISRPIMQGLGASRDKGMRVILAFQSFTDLRDCPADMSPEMVVGGVIENTPCKLIYKLEDPDTADWFARKSGIILVDDETRVLDRNVALAETAQGERSIRQSEHYLIDTNQMQNLTAGWGVLYGQGLAKPCYVSPYRVEKYTQAITPHAATPAIVANALLPARPSGAKQVGNFFDLGE